MSEPFIGEIRIFGGNFAPRGWALCQGQLLSIAQNTALFSLLGTTYGGNGQTTFALPDLRGRAPIGMGQGPGLSPRQIGQQTGVEQVTLTSAQLPAHSHQLQAGGSPTTNNPAGSTLPVGTSRIYGTGPASAQLAAASITSTGGSQAHENMPPVMAMNYIIALQGIYPSRN